MVCCTPEEYRKIKGVCDTPEGVVQSAVAAGRGAAGWAELLADILDSASS